MRLEIKIWKKIAILDRIVFKEENRNSKPWTEVRLYNTQREVRCLVDSGADVNLFKPGIIKGECEVKECKVDLRTASNTLIQTLEKCRIKMMVVNKMVEDVFVVTEDVETDFTIVMPLLNKYKATLRFGTKFEWSLDKDERKQSILGRHKIITTMKTSVMAPLYKLGAGKEKLASEFIKKDLE